MAPTSSSLNQHLYRVHTIQSYEPWFCLQINLLWLSHIDSSSVNLRGWAKFHCPFLTVIRYLKRAITLSPWTSLQGNFHFFERTWVWDWLCYLLKMESGLLSPSDLSKHSMCIPVSEADISLTAQPLHLYECRLRDGAFIFFLWVALPNCHLKYPGLIHSSFCTIYLFEYRFRTFPYPCFFLNTTFACRKCLLFNRY